MGGGDDGLGAQCFELQPASHRHQCVYIGQIPERCVPLSPVPGKVCGKSIEVHCGGKGIVWSADPDRTGQREGDQTSEERSGASGKGGGTWAQRYAHHCPPVSK